MQGFHRNGGGVLGCDHVRPYAVYNVGFLSLTRGGIIPSMSYCAERIRYHCRCLTAGVSGNLGCFTPLYYGAFFV